jgi:hypothetical protein
LEVVSKNIEKSPKSGCILARILSLILEPYLYNRRRVDRTPFFKTLISSKCREDEPFSLVVQALAILGC